MTEGDTIAVTATLNDVVVGGKPSLEIISGDKYVSVNGNVITATAENGEETVTVKATYRNASWTINLVVFEAVEITDHETEYQFSAYDGKFFNGDTVVTLDEILGAGVEITRAYDKDGNALEVKDGAILGLDLGKQTTWAQNSITVYTADGATRIFVDAADAIIDEAKDLKVFSFKGDAFVNKKIVIEDGFIWDGYYVVVKDIDALAQGYVHKSATDEDDSPADLSLDTVSASKVGLSGVFDGQGHTISNLMINSYVSANQTGSGLFTFINGGKVKNVNFYNICASTKLGTIEGETTNIIANSGALATYMVNNAVIENIYLTYYSVANGSHARVLYYNATAGCEVKNSVINYQSNFNALTSSSTVHNANGGGLYAGNSATYTNVYYISDLCLVVGGRGSTENKLIKKETQTVVTIGTNVVRWRKVGTDAEYVDDVASTTADYVLADSQGTQYHFDKFDVYTGDTIALSSAYEIKTLAGVKRYTSISAMENNWANNEEGSALRNDFSTWDTNVWTISSKGVPTMKVMTNA